MAIDLNFNEQQKIIQDTARQFFASDCPPSLVRRYENSEDAFPRDLWRKMADLGWLGMCFPEAYDGLGCSFTDMFALYLELGRALVPSPHMDTVALGGALVARLGSEEQKTRILPAVGRGETILSFAVLEPSGVYGPEGTTLSASPRGDGYALNGVKVLAPYAGQADLLLVPVRTGPSDGAGGVSLFLVSPQAPGVSLERTANMAGYPLYTVAFSDVAVRASDALGPIGGVWAALDEEMAKAAVLQSAMIIGAGERVLDMTVGYARERVQFGQPIGKHQAVQYLASDIAIQNQNAQLLALHAAWRIDTGRSFLREASLAKAAASKAAAGMTFAAHEVHAGIGFMIDYDLQLYTMRCKHWEYNLGDARYHLERALHESEGRNSIFEAA